MATSVTVGFISDNHLGYRLLERLSQNGVHIQYYNMKDASPVNADRHSTVMPCSSATEAARGASVICLVMWDLAQLEVALDGVLAVVEQETAVVLCGPLLPTYITKLEAKITDKQTRFKLVNAYIYSGANSKMTMLASGEKQSMEKAQSILSDMCDNLVLLDGGLVVASQVQMVDKMLQGIHIVAAAEAIALGASAGLNTWDLYEIIINAAGSSRAFETRVPQMLENDDHCKEATTTVDHQAKDMNSILEEAQILLLPLPLAAIAHQYFRMGSSFGHGSLSDAGVVKVWQTIVGHRINNCMKNEQGLFKRKAEEIFKGAAKVENIGFIGLGAMGFGMASTLVQKNFTVCGFDVYEPTLSRFRSAGGQTENSVKKASKGAQIVIVMVATEAQVEAVLFGENGAVGAAPDGCTFILCSTVSPLYVEGLQKRLEAEGRDLQLVDAPVSGGVKRAADGTLTIMAAGTTEAFRRAGQVLQALSETLYVIDGGAGKGSAVKAVNQLLAGVHIAAACEGMALGARLGLNTRYLYQLIANSDGSSWMFVNRVPHMLDADFTPYSAVNIFVKDLGIVLSQGRSCRVPLHLAATAHQQFLLAAAGGFAFKDDSAVVKIYEKVAGISVACKEPASSNFETPQGPPISHKSSKVDAMPKKQLMESLGPEWPTDPLDEISKLEGNKQTKVLVVLDDDPTGTQTVHGITVLTEWTVDSLKEEFLKQPSCFFILTNSRALSSEKASALVKSIASNVKTAATLTSSSFTIVLRGDSTLRGHFPEELYAVGSIIGETDAWIICPFFPQGGRYTIHDLHFVADGEILVPAGETEFAKDSVFGYKASNMKEWVAEKTKGRVKAADVASVSIETLRKGGPPAVCENLCNLPKGSICIVNAASERDMLIFCAGMLQAEAKGKLFLCRTAATFVSARIGIKYKAPLTPKDVGISASKNGGLIVVGSFVPKTTKQVEELKARCLHLVNILEVNVPIVASGSMADREAEIKHISTTADALLAAGKDTVIMTSRTLITGKDDSENLEINSRVSTTLVEIVKQIQVHPRYLLAKGGITSSDLATKAMKAKKAEVLGQALPGVPIWKLGVGSRHPGMPYIVFPGNVGSPGAIADIVMAWASKPPQITKEILLAAAAGDYAVGAFNIYNIEGILAVISAAEFDSSPAILQIHPSALRHGERVLVAACISAAKSAKVPIAVHLDHGTDEQEILAAIDMGFDSVMIDCSHLPFEENLDVTKRITEAAHSRGVFVEAELGRLSGTEDGMTVEEYEEKLTDTLQADEFLMETKVDALAVCIGNVHGKYPKDGPKLNLDLLEKLEEVASKNNTFLVLHGASGLPNNVIKECIKKGVRKFNVNTEVRSAYIAALKEPKKDLLDLMSSAEEAMKMVVRSKLEVFESSRKS